MHYQGGKYRFVKHITPIIQAGSVAERVFAESRKEPEAHRQTQNRATVLQNEQRGTGWTHQDLR